MATGFGLWGACHGTNPAFHVNLNAAPTPAIRMQSAHVVSEALKDRHPNPEPAFVDATEASVAYGHRGVLRNLEVLETLVELGDGSDAETAKKRDHLSLLAGQLTTSDQVGVATSAGAVNLCAKLLRDDNFSVVSMSASVLAKIGSQRCGKEAMGPVAGQIAQLLSHAEPKVREAAATALRVVGDTIEGRRLLVSSVENAGVATALVTSVRATTPKAKLDTFVALAMLCKEEEACISALRAGLMGVIVDTLRAGDPPSSIVQLLQSTVAHLAGKEAAYTSGVVPRLAPLLRSTREDLRRLASSSLVLIVVHAPAKREAIPCIRALITLLKDPNRDIMMNALFCLRGICEDPQASTECMSLLAEQPELKEMVSKDHRATLACNRYL